MTRILHAPPDYAEDLNTFPSNELPHGPHAELAAAIVEAAASDTVRYGEWPEHAERVLVAYAKAALAAARAMRFVAKASQEDEIIVIIGSEKGDCAVVVTPNGAAIRPAGKATMKTLEDNR
jgi:hypothetical protein